MDQYLGHTCGDRVQTVKEHLEGTAMLSGEFASRFGKRDWGYCCGRGSFAGNGTGTGGDGDEAAEFV